jgi:leucyl/phenylalanyl-tRNA---protein transferase
VLAWLGRADPFPPSERALKSPNGLLAAGGDLSVERLLEAYRRGIFPWYSGGQPPLWWSPDPRMVLYCAEIKVARSLAKSIRNKGY